MCGICEAFRPTDDDCVYEDNATYATITEGSDAAAGTNTNYTMSVGDTFSGTLSSNSDVDWVEINLTAGETYTISMTGSSTLTDTYLDLYDAGGNVVTYDDDSGPGLYSEITFAATSSGTYYIGGAAYPNASNYGAYTIDVETTEPVAEGSLDELADYLTDGFWSDYGGDWRSFNTSSSNVITVNISDLNATERDLALAALESWEMVADVSFSVTTSTGADIMFYNDDNGNSTSLNAYSTSDLSGNTINSSDVVITSGWVNSYMGDEIGTYGFQTYIHEIGHALGLGHQSAYNGSANFPSDADFANDSWQMSIMSYFSQSENTNVSASLAYLVTTMMADIRAIQNLYGAAGAGSVTSGDTIWGVGTNLNNYLGDLFNDWENGTNTVYSGDPIAFTIYDADGTDTLNLSISTSDDRIDMQDGTFSDVDGLIGNVGIMVGTVVENLYAGSGNDDITGNSANNEIYGGAGDDTIRALDGDDIVDGEGGSDIVYLGDGADRFNGSSDVDGDTVYGGAGSDIMSGGSAMDELRGEDGWDRIYGGDGNDLIVGGQGNDRLYGQDDNDSIYGESDDDIMYGGNGADWMSGGTGDDRVSGDAGDDELYGGDGNDYVYGGTENDTIYGNGSTDRLYGQDGNDTIFGGAGRDYIYGGDGADRASGEDGNDIMFGGAGYDRLWGGTGSDSINGEAGVDRLYGQDGDDTLSGGEDADYLYGGNDNDTLFGDSGADILSGDAGVDQLDGGTEGDRLYGGTGDDTLIGGDGYDRLYGQDDNDILYGGQGNDYLYGGDGNDTLYGGTGDDTLVGNVGEDTFVFDEVALGTDMINDFTLTEDTLSLSSDIWGGTTLTANQVVSTYGVISNGDLILDFGDTTIILSGVTDTAGLASDISIIA